LRFASLSLLLLLFLFVAGLGLTLSCDDTSPATTDGPLPVDATVDAPAGTDHAIRPDLFMGDVVESTDSGDPDTSATDASMPDSSATDTVGSADGGCGPNGTPCELDHDTCTNDECQNGQCITNSVSINGLACTVGGQAGTCLFAACCTGCLGASPKACAPGNSDTACGSAGAACVDCTATGDHCCGGACQASPCP
jgi:hypothetical protein